MACNSSGELVHHIPMVIALLLCRFRFPTLTIP
nr:MAG TPA: hypothetical protein [Caudoviricetes sp.]